MKASFGRTKIALAAAALRTRLAGKPHDAPGFTFQASNLAKPGAVVRRLSSRRVRVPNIELLDDNYFIGRRRKCFGTARKIQDGRDQRR